MSTQGHDKIRDYCYSRVKGILDGLQQAEIGIVNNRDFRLSAVNAPRYINVTLKNINPGYYKIIQNQEIQLCMWAGLDSKKESLRFGFVGTNISIQVPKEQGYWKQIDIAYLKQRRALARLKPGQIVIGVNGDESAALLDFNKEHVAHLFLTGQTRSGKTNAQKLVVANLSNQFNGVNSRDNPYYLIVDVAKRGYKWREFNGVAGNAVPVITTIKEAEAALSWVNMEMERRSVGGEGSWKNRIYLVIDELKDLMDESPYAKTVIPRLASIAGELGIHLILATQFPSAKFLSAALKRNVTTRLTGKVDDATASVQATGIPGAQADKLMGYGDMLFLENGGIDRVTIAEITSDDIANLNRQAHGNLIELPKEILDVREIAQAKRTPLVDNPAALVPATSSGRPGPAQDEFTPLQIAYAMTRPCGINALAGALRIGSSKAARLRLYAAQIAWHAYRNGADCLPAPSDWQRYLGKGK